ncbi:MAG: PilN domain-containing protein [Gammaproteobacteria bacterium]|nr:PilN domain-containing protein [Gammaproteobacteria bacterium]
MARINLLPWREWERERRQKEFLTNLGGILVVGLVLIFSGGLMLDRAVEQQNGRNQFLQRHIDDLDRQIAEIRDLRKTKDELLSRMQVIQELQGNRPVIVRVFDEIVRTLAKGVHYRELSMVETKLSVHGTAESNNRISSLMRALDKSDWFAQPNLTTIKEDPTNSDYGEQASTFDLTFVQVNPNLQVEGE